MPDIPHSPEPADPSTGAATDFRRLPEPIALEDTVATQDVRDAPDPDAGRDPNHEWMMRYG